MRFVHLTLILVCSVFSISEARAELENQGSAAPPLAVGSAYRCFFYQTGFDGPVTTKLFKKNGKGFKQIAFDLAKKEISALKSPLAKSISAMKSAAALAKKNKPVSSSTLATAKSLAKSVGFKFSPGTTNATKAAALTGLVAALNAKNINLGTQVSGVDKCKNKTILAGNTFTPRFVSAKLGENRLTWVMAHVGDIANLPSTGSKYCVRGEGQSFGYKMDTGTDLCLALGYLDACPEYSIGLSIIIGHLYQGYSGSSDYEQQQEAEFRAEGAAKYSYRLANPVRDYCDDI